MRDTLEDYGTVVPPSELPSGWSLQRLESIARNSHRKVSPEELGDVEVSLFSIPSLQDTGAPEIQSASEIGSDKILLGGGELLVSKLNPRKGMVIHVPARDALPMLASSEFVPIRPPTDDARFLYFVLKSSVFRHHLASAVQSATRSHQRVKPAHILKAKIPVPPTAYMRQIADFLDRKTAHIDTLIEQKERLIELLDEKRSALITHVVTKGLNPDAPMKDSGVEWIGKIPESWRVIPLKHVLTALTTGVSVSGDTSSSAEQGSLGVLKTSSVLGDVFRPEENKAVRGKEQDRLACPVVGRSLIISRMNTPELVGSCGYVHEDHPDLYLPDRLWQTTTRTDRCEPRFAWMLLRAPGMRRQLATLATGASGSMRCLAQADLLRARIGLPPLAEQRAILHRLEDDLERCDELERSVRRAMTLLRERRSALVTAAVTGQIDVGEYAA